MSFLDDLSSSGATSDLLNAVTDYASNTGGNSYGNYNAPMQSPFSASTSNNSTLLILGAIVLAIFGFIFLKR